MALHCNFACKQLLAGSAVVAAHGCGAAPACWYYHARYCFDWIVHSQYICRMQILTTHPFFCFHCSVRGCRLSNDAGVQRYAPVQWFWSIWCALHNHVPVVFFFSSGLHRMQNNLCWSNNLRFRFGLVLRSWEELKSNLIIKWKVLSRY